MEENATCPLCGKELKGNKTFCTDCEEIAQNAYPEELLSHNNVILDNRTDRNWDEKSPHKKSNKKLFAFLITGLILLVTIGGIGTYYVAKEKKSAEAETNYWFQTMQENTSLGYAKYLARYPEGNYMNEAYQKLADFKYRDQQEWESIQQTDSVVLYLSYLSKNPQSPYKQDILKSIDSIAWVNASAENTVEAYANYLKGIEHSDFVRLHKESAAEKIDSIRAFTSIAGEELEEIKQVMAFFFKSLSLRKDKDMAKHTTPILSKFFESNNKLHKEIIDSLNKGIKQQKLRNITFVPLLDSSRVIRNNKTNIYIATLPLEIETNFIDRKKMKESKDTIATIELNQEKRIQALY